MLITHKEHANELLTFLKETSACPLSNKDACPGVCGQGTYGLNAGQQGKRRQIVFEKKRFLRDGGWASGKSALCTSLRNWGPS